MKKLLILSLVLLTACGGGWSPWERQVIGADGADKGEGDLNAAGTQTTAGSDKAAPMYVTVLPQDSVILRARSRDLGDKELKSKELKMLADKMLATVTHPSQDGVGIAAPQVGINRRVVWVQRFDKPGEPFECYVNVGLDSLYGKITHGPEGCLSVPPMRGYVPRYSGVVVHYTDPASGHLVREQVEGYTAIIFQHECDHLEGTLYIDRADTVFVSEDWARERQAFDYTRPVWWNR